MSKYSLTVTVKFSILYQESVLWHEVTVYMYVKCMYSLVQIKCTSLTMAVVGVYRPPYSKTHPITEATF